MKSVSSYMLVLNEATFVRHAIHSVLRYVDELLVIDGGSSDCTRDIVTEIASIDRRVRLEVWPQSGVPYTAAWHEPTVRNTAMTKLAHDWVLTLDADEVLEADENLFRSLDEPAVLTRLNLVSYSRYIHRMGVQLWYPDSQLRFYNRRNAVYPPQALHSIATQANGQPMPFVTVDATLWHYNGIVKPRRQWLADNPTAFTSLPCQRRAPVTL